jgi:predicted transcriptional regulator
MMNDRVYEKKKQTILRIIKKHRKVNHSFILNNVNIDYETLMKILSELRMQGCLD